MRYGLCCKFDQAPIHFKTATATAVLKLPREDALRKISSICLHNANALKQAIGFCSENRIGAFRINSQVLPLKTHPQVGYEVKDLPDAHAIRARFRDCGRCARANDIRTLFHPDQFVVLSSVDLDLTQRSVRELEYQAEVADWVGADVINIHAGGGYGDKPAALDRVEKAIRRLSPAVRSRLTLENDDRVYAPADLLPLCQRTGIPMIYDVHHHRCMPDGLSEEDVTHRARETWNREPVFHISSPRDGWGGPNTRHHHDYIQLADFPFFWKKLDITVEVEAKAKELAVRRLMMVMQAR